MRCPLRRSPRYQAADVTMTSADLTTSFEPDSQPDQPAPENTGFVPPQFEDVARRDFAPTDDSPAPTNDSDDN